MAKNQTGIAIALKAWLPLGKSLEEQIAALELVRDAHAKGDYTALLNAAKVEDVKTEQRTKRVEEPILTGLREAVAGIAAPVDDGQSSLLADLPQAAPEGEPSLQDIADNGTDSGAAMQPARGKKKANGNE